MSSAYVPSRGGVEKCVWELSTRFAAAGHKVTVVTSSRGGGRDHMHMANTEGIHVIRYPEKLHFFEAPLIPQIAVKGLVLDYDVLHIHGMSPTITDLGIVLAKLRKKPVVLTYHNDIESDYGGRFGRLARFLHQKLSVPIVGMSNMIVATSASYAHTSPVLTGLKHKSMVIPMGVNPEKYVGDNPVPPEAKEKRILFVGQLKDYKGVHHLIEAVAELRREGLPVNLDVVGSGPSSGKLKTKALNLGLRGPVRFWDKVNNAMLLAFYAFTDLVVLPSTNRREAFGIVQLEAMAAGKPVVVSDIPGVRDVALQGGGILARPGDVPSLKAAILKGFSSNVDEERLRRVVEAHSWDRIAMKYLDIFKSVIPMVTTTISPSLPAPIPQTVSASYPPAAGGPSAESREERSQKRSTFSSVLATIPLIRKRLAQRRGSMA